MRSSNHIRNKIKAFEGFRSVPDNKDGTYTIGWGHTATAANYIGKSITRQQGEALLNLDILEAERKIKNWQRVNRIQLLPAQFDALVSFVFNVGNIPISITNRIKRLRGDSVNTTINKYVRSGGSVMPGLVIRRRFEGSLFNRPKIIIAGLLLFTILQRLQR